LRLSLSCGPGGVISGVSGTEFEAARVLKSSFPETALGFVEITFKEAGGEDAFDGR